MMFSVILILTDRKLLQHFLDDTMKLKLPNLGPRISILIRPPFSQMLIDRCFIEITFIEMAKLVQL